MDHTLVQIGTVMKIEETSVMHIIDEDRQIYETKCAMNLFSTIVRIFMKSKQC